MKLGYALDIKKEERLGEITKNDASYYLDAQLRALKPGTVHSYANGPVTREYDTGSIVGEIFSWVTRDGEVWWQLKEGGFVKHEKGKFDPRIAQDTSQGKASDLLSDAFGNSGGGLPLPGLDDLKKIAIVGGLALLGGLAVYTYINIKATKKLINKAS